MGSILTALVALSACGNPTATEVAQVNTAAPAGTSAGPSSASAASFSHQPDTQKAFWYSGRVRGSNSWTDIPFAGVGCSKTSGECKDHLPLLIPSTGRIVASLNAIISGGSIELRVLDYGANGSQQLRPGVISVPTGAAAVKFISGAGGRDDGCSGLRVQWRSKAGSSAQLIKPVLLLDFKHSGRNSNLGCA
jgi:hypothetical protein